jgi:NAD(P)-dependent dehydrogenase (short-subunit alcohol dehydrogenase family)
MKKAFVSGAGGGLGGACVAALRRAGYSVVGTDIRSGPWESLCTPVVGEIGDPQWAELVNSALQEGCDLAVAAHGIEGTGAFRTLTVERLKQVMVVNFESMVTVFETVRNTVRQRSGAFVAISSQAGLQGEPASAAYCASKFAVIGWMRGLVNVEPDIRLRTLCPGATATNLLRSAFEGMASAEGITYEDIVSRRSAAVPVGRLGIPAEIGAGALWLGELQTSSHVTGLVSGGEVRL